MNRIKNLLALLPFLLLMGCSVLSKMPAAAPLTAPIPTEGVTADVQKGSSGLNADEITTLQSLEKVDDYPLYTMHYIGATDPTLERLGGRARNTDWGCSLFAALGDPNAMLYGRNFDWRYSPALLLFTDPSEGYASVSMVDMEYLGIDINQVGALTDFPLDKRTALLLAPLLPFDGMNETGLAVGMAAVPGSTMPYDSAKKTVDSLMAIREMLDHARTVNEAVAILGSYNIDWGSGPALHYLIADAAGAAVLVEFYKGKLVTLPNSNPWHLATNHLRTTAKGEGGCDRYARIDARLTGSSGQLKPEEAVQLLAEVSQTGSNTQWSILYGISTGEIRIAMDRKYDTVHTFHLPMARP